MSSNLQSWMSQFQSPKYLGGNPESRTHSNLSQPNEIININEFYTSQLREKDSLIVELQKRVQELELHIMRLNDDKKDLEFKIKTKELDFQELSLSLKKNAISPLFFCSDDRRNEFWKLVNENKNFMDERAQLISEFDEKIEKLFQENQNLKVQLEYYKKENLDKEVILETNRRLINEIENLRDQLHKEQAQIKDLGLKVNLIEKQYQISEKSRMEALDNLGRMNNLLQNRFDDYNQDKNKILNMMQKFNVAREKFDLLDRNQGFQRGEIANLTSKLSINQILLRLKTTTIGSDKFAETIDLLSEIYTGSLKENEQNRNNTQGVFDKYKERENLSIIAQIKESENYKLILKGLLSKNDRVLISSIRFIIELGEIGLRYKEYLETGSSAALAKILKISDDQSVKQNTMQILIGQKLTYQSLLNGQGIIDLGKNSIEICKQMGSIGLVDFIVTEINLNSHATALKSTYLLACLKLANVLLANQYGQEEFSQNMILDSIFRILKQTDFIDIKKAILSIIPYISEKAEQRQRLQDREFFSIIMNIFMDAITTKDQEFLYLSVTSIANFANDSHSRIIIASSNRTHETFKIFTKCIDRTNIAPAECRLAAAAIISRLLKNEPSQSDSTLKDDLIFAGLIGALIVGLGDEEGAVQEECLATLMQLKDFIPTHYEELKHAIQPLIRLLGTGTDDLVHTSLAYLEALTANPRLVKVMIDLGLVSILSSYFIHDTRFLKPDVLYTSGMLLLKLQADDYARNQMVMSQVIFTILPLATHPDELIRKFWYEAFGELLNHKEFRNQLENEQQSVKFIKKALYELEMRYYEQFCFGMRVLCQSPILMNLIIDEITIPMLCNFYRGMMKTATKDYIIYMIETLSIICQNKLGRDNILKNIIICEILVLCIQKEDVEIANKAAKLIIHLLQNSTSEEQNILKTTPIVEAAMIYATTSDIEGKAFATTLLLDLVKDPYYQAKLKLAGLKDANDIKGFIDAQRPSSAYLKKANLQLDNQNSKRNSNQLEPTEKKPGNSRKNSLENQTISKQNQQTKSLNNSLNQSKKNQISLLNIWRLEYK